MMTPGEIDGVFAGLDTKLRKFRQEVGMEVRERVEQRTPVVTGELQNGWGFDLNGNDIRFWNVAPYSFWVEYGTEQMAPRGMLRTTLLELPDICERVSKKLKMK
jgi:hypothetical protein